MFPNFSATFLFYESKFYEIYTTETDAVCTAIRFIKIIFDNTFLI